MSKEYDPKEIENKWQKEWEKSGIYTTPDESNKEKFYFLVEFPYPSGNLHVGHWYAFAVPDIAARFHRMSGKNVLYPIGFDAFGLPAENAAIQRGLNPREWTISNIDYMKNQLRSMGASFDWSREVVTCTPEYYKWTQWLFLKLFKNSLAYQAEREVNWCPKDKTVLANEQVVDGKCERCGTEVVMKNLLQWNIKITDYADKLIDGLENLDWPKAIKESQKNWIGRSDGALIKFDDVEVFTTRPDTIFGATFVVVSGKEDRFTGRYVTNPATKEKIPVWEAEYVYSDYGTGAIMGVPADDERDMEFAKKYDLPIITDYKKAGAEDFGKKVTKYKLRDWVVSRQRYWGVPIPIIHCEKCGAQPVPDDDLPVMLPEIADYLPRDDGKSPLAKAREWAEVKCPKCGGTAERETDTLDTFVDSSWYFLRYTDPKNKELFADKDKLKSWMPVDFYSGGAEHTTMHLLYSRFWHKALFDLGLVNENEPYLRRMNRGLIMGPDGQKMSKSKGNVIDPDKEVERLGSDTVRTYLAFIGPYNEVGAYPWNPDGAVGVRRFLERVWRLENKIGDSAPENNLLHPTIKKVGEEISSMKMNTAVSALMILVNSLDKQENISKDDYKTLLLLLAPLAPHITEELWQDLGHKDSIHTQTWPTYDPKKIEKDEVTLAIQIDGKVRATLSTSRDQDEEGVKTLALALPEVKKWLGDKEPKRVIIVPGRIISIITTAKAGQA
ncbi:MAG: leucine--tRNA ligase [Minisyncoccia bacterium]